MPSDGLHRDALPRHAVPRPQDAARGALLLVEGSHGQRALLQRILSMHGFSVTAIAALRRQAAGALAAQPFDHAVLDLRLPDRDGLALLRSLRQTRPQARIVVVTDADSFATVVLALLDRASPLPPVPQTPLGLHRTCWEHVMRVYEQCDRNMTRAAERLGMHRRSLQRFLSKRAPPPRAGMTSGDEQLMPAHLVRSSVPGKAAFYLSDREATPCS